MQEISHQCNKDMGKEEDIQESISSSQGASTLLPGVPPMGWAPTKPQLPPEESGEEPGVNRFFSLNGIDYFCNQHLAAKTEHPLLQDCKTKITQGKGKKRENSEAVLLPNHVCWVSAI